MSETPATQSTGDREANAVILDIGNVLLDWDPRTLYGKIFTTDDGRPDTDKMEWFLANICTQVWNVQQDLGRSIVEANATLTLQHPKWHAEIEAYYERFNETISGAIESTVACMRDLREVGIPVHCLTNFGSETFAGAREQFDFLNEFDGVVISGEEGLIKPDPEIFGLIVNRFKLAPERTLFVDDTLANIKAARSLGFLVHHFTDTTALRPHLMELGLLRG